jgi:hypothetical protein
MKQLPPTTSLPLSLDGMLARARLFCVHKLPKHPVYNTGSHPAVLSSTHLTGFLYSTDAVPCLQ